MCGLPVEIAAALINAIGARIADGERFAPGDVLDDIFPSGAAARAAHPAGRAIRGVVPQGDRRTALLTFRPVEIDSAGARPPARHLRHLLRHGPAPVPAGRVVRREPALPLGAGLPRRVRPDCSRCCGCHRDDNPPVGVDPPGPADLSLSGEPAEHRFCTD